MANQLAQQHNDYQREYYSRPTRASIAHTESPYIQRHLDEVLRLAGLAPGARILDAGCGLGRHSVLLAERGYRVEGLELSPQLLEQMKRLSRHDIPTYCADIAQPPAGLEARYDGVLGFFVLHHLSDLRAAFAGVARVLKPGGVAVFIEPNPYNPLYYVQISLTPGMRWQAEKGILDMRRAPLFAAFAQAGLQSHSLYRFGFLPPFLRNLPGGGAVDRAIEAARVFEPTLPFQIFHARKAG